jgi:hypothetical protein
VAHLLVQPNYGDNNGLRRSYTIFIELKNVSPGLGWNEDKQIVDASNEFWEEHLAVSVTTKY